MKTARILIIIALAAAPLVAEAGAVARVKTRHAGERARGVDVSEWDGRIDWGRVRRSGIAFAIARVSDGLHHDDATFARNYAGAKRSGLVRGAYQFFRPQEDGAMQAELLCSRVRSLAPGDLPPVLDVEVTDGASASRIAREIDRWVAVVERRLGVAPMIYTAPGFWSGLDRIASVGRVELWVADWGVARPSLPRGFGDWTIWQTSDAGRVSGISGNVDVNVFHGTRADLRSFVGLAP